MKKIIKENAMMMTDEKKLRRRIRFLIILFILCLLLSGITAFPIESELSIANNNLSLMPGFVRDWISNVYCAVRITNENFPYLSYGTDWLAFAHIIIAVAFIGPLKDPVKNIWVIQFGMAACCMILPFALIAGHIRGIPFYWQLIDCSFGVLGIIPLFLCYRYIRMLSFLQSKERTL
jgi:hypothetical protein